MDRFISSQKKIKDQELLPGDKLSVSFCLKQILSPQDKSLNRVKSQEFSERLSLHTQIAKKLENLTIKSPTICHKSQKALEALSLHDDYGANPLHCSGNGVLAVGLSRGVYLWNKNGKITRIREATGLRSLNWSAMDPNLIACGSSKEDVELWDSQEGKMIWWQKMQGKGRVNTLAWIGSCIYVGLKEGSLIEIDIRIPKNHKPFLHRHKGEVITVKPQHCSMKYLATGSMDKWVGIWDLRTKRMEIRRKTQGIPRAIAWHPSNPNFLAMGEIGKKAQSEIKIFNVSSNELFKTINTSSQTCCLEYSSSGEKLVSSHGGGQNSINIWDKDMRKEKILVSHKWRPLYLTVQPDDRKIISGSGDQSIRFWNFMPEVDENPLNDHCYMQIR